MGDRWDRIRHFKPEEFVKPDILRWEMIRKLDELRDRCGFALRITSSYRDPEHNTKVGGVPESSHCVAPDGMYSGIDISIDSVGGSGIFQLVRNAFTVGFNRIGIYPKHIHLDVESRLLQQVLWIGQD